MIFYFKFILKNNHVKMTKFLPIKLEKINNKLIINEK